MYGIKFKYIARQMVANVEAVKLDIVIPSCNPSGSKFRVISHDVEFAGITIPK